MSAIGRKADIPDGLVRCPLMTLNGHLKFLRFDLPHAQNGQFLTQTAGALGLTPPQWKPDGQKTCFLGQQVPSFIQFPTQMPEFLEFVPGWQWNPRGQSLELSQRVGAASEPVGNDNITKIINAAKPVVTIRFGSATRCCLCQSRPLCLKAVAGVRFGPCRAHAATLATNSPSCALSPLERCLRARPW